jgi:hypothetical protein
MLDYLTSGWSQCEKIHAFQPFIVYGNDLFTKTGSGQIWGKHSKKDRFSSGAKSCSTDASVRVLWNGTTRPTAPALLPFPDSLD